MNPGDKQLRLYRGGWKYPKPRTDEDREAIRQRMKGNTHFLGHSHTEATRKKMSERARKGEASNFWKGGATDENKRLRMSAEFRCWREAVYERDNWTCQGCGEKGGRLHPHHIKRFSDYPELRFDVSNGLTLCVPCHKKTPNYGRKRSEVQELRDAGN